MSEQSAMTRMRYEMLKGWARRVSARVPQEDCERILAEAGRRRTSFSGTIAELLREALDKRATESGETNSG